MTARRFTDKPALDPKAVMALATDHPAMAENRTLFPTTVVDVDDSFEGRLLVSGKNNRKLGETVAKGIFKDYALFQLSLEERATCPADCTVRAQCYGNGMQFARRHRIADLDYFALLLEDEIKEALQSAPGVLVRLHCLGDFETTDYVAMWADILNDYPKVAAYGYTARRTTAWGGDDIGDAIESLKERFPQRFRIRWSSEVSRPDGAVVIDRIPNRPRVDEGLVCPAQTEASACCASCGLCWEQNFRRDTIVFIQHGRHSVEKAAGAARDSATVDTNGMRRIAPMELSSAVKPAQISTAIPQPRMVAPTSLLVEPSYQRALSGKSVNLIRKLVSKWNWTKFKPPLCVETPAGLLVVDGQHTAIAAASHGGIPQIPVMVSADVTLADRASAFVAHNRDRIAMTAAQVFYGEVIAGDVRATAVLDAVTAAGASIPRMPSVRGKAKVGEISAIAEVRRIESVNGAAMLSRVLRTTVLAGLAPVPQTVIRALRILYTEQTYHDIVDRPSERVAAAIKTFDNIDLTARRVAAESGKDRDRACAELIADKVRRLG